MMNAWLTFRLYLFRRYGVRLPSNAGRLITDGKRVWRVDAKTECHVHEMPWDGPFKCRVCGATVVESGESFVLQTGHRARCRGRVTTEGVPMTGVDRRFVEVEVTVGPWLRGALLDAGFLPDNVLLAPVHTWFPFSSPDVIRVQFEVEGQQAEGAPKDG